MDKFELWARRFNVYWLISSSFAPTELASRICMKIVENWKGRKGTLTNPTLMVMRLRMYLVDSGARHYNATTMFEADVLVIGAGAVGLAIAKSLSQRDLRVIILEEAAEIGSNTSRRCFQLVRKQSAPYFCRMLCMTGTHGISHHASVLHAQPSLITE